MQKRFFGWVGAMTVVAELAAAQQSQFYIQVEARPSLEAAQERAQNYARQFGDVNGFFLGQGWYGIAVGPFSSYEIAQAELGRLNAIYSLPSDAYVENGQLYGRQFWPIGASLGAPSSVATPADILEIAEPRPEDNGSLDEETLAEARQSESRLNRVQREELQVALNWAGVYSSGIDGAFGRGTRRAMSAWQALSGFEPTGVLTSRQRADLLAQYNAVLEGLGFETYQDLTAGISIDIPLAVVNFDKHEAPFAIFEAGSDMPEAMVLLISQSGDRQNLAGLYEIMQTLEIVPTTGARSRTANGFQITGENNRILSHTEVTLKDGEIKGFTLVWPTGDQERRNRVLSKMQNSFSRLDGVLSSDLTPSSVDGVDLISGLAVRRPIRDGSGFFVDDKGHVVTSASLVEECGRITLNHEYDARLLASTEAGIAILKPVSDLAPSGTVTFAADPVAQNAKIAIAGYSYGGILPSATLNFGSVEGVQGLGGETGLIRLAVATQDGDLGGPVLNDYGQVAGMLVPQMEGEARRLPDSVTFAAKADVLQDALEANGVDVQVSGGRNVMADEDLTTLAANTIVLVNCWN